VARICIDMFLHHVEEEREDEEETDERTKKQLQKVGVLTLKLKFIDDMTTRKHKSGGKPQYSQTPRALLLDQADVLPRLGVVTEKSMKGDAITHQAR
jgi:hypothetical protein